jgi:hypothetical protein
LDILNIRVQTARQNAYEGDHARFNTIIRAVTSCPARNNRPWQRRLRRS